MAWRSRFSSSHVVLAQITTQFPTYQRCKRWYKASNCIKHTLWSINAALAGGFPSRQFVQDFSHYTLIGVWDPIYQRPNESFRLAGPLREDVVVIIIIIRNATCNLRCVPSASGGRHVSGTAGAAGRWRLFRDRCQQLVVTFLTVITNNIFWVILSDVRPTLKSLNIYEPEEIIIHVERNILGHEEEIVRVFIED